MTALESQARHTYKPGDQVAVFNMVGERDHGKMIVEGRGTVRSVVPDIDEQYLVEFDGGAFERFVDPLGQDDPEGYCNRINRQLAGARG